MELMNVEDKENPGFLVPVFVSFSYQSIPWWHGIFIVRLNLYDLKSNGVAHGACFGVFLYLYLNRDGCHSIQK